MGGEGVASGEGGGLREEVREGDVSKRVSEAVRRVVSDRLLSNWETGRKEGKGLERKMGMYRSSRVWLAGGIGWTCSWWETPFSR